MSSRLSLCCKLKSAYLNVGCSFYIASADPARAAREERMMLDALVGETGSEEKIKQFFFDKTRELMERESCKTVAKGIHTVDLVRSVLRVVPIYWACDMVRRSSSGCQSVHALKFVSEGWYSAEDQRGRRWGLHASGAVQHPGRDLHVSLSRPITIPSHVHVH